MKKYQLEIRWALIFSAMMLLWMLGERLSGLHDEHIDKHPVWSNLVLFPAITVYVLALIDKRKKSYNGLMSYKQGLITGLWMTAFVTLLSPINQLITSLIITPDYFQNAIAYATENGLLTPEAAVDHFNLNNYLKLTVVSTPIIGVVTTIIVAIFTRKSA